MYRILLVDDEPLIVDTLARLVDGMDGHEFDVCRAYTVIDAMNWLERARIDIVLSDMRMPGMSGVELQQEVLRRWPRCRIIFLTAYDDLAYAQQAIANGQLSAYLTKNMDNKVIVRAIDKAVEQIRREWTAQDLLLRAKFNMKQALPLLRKDYVMKLLQGTEPYTLAELSSKFGELELDLDPRSAVCLLLGRVDAWPAQTTLADKTLLQYAVQNIAEEYMEPYAELSCIVPDDSHLMWFLQPRSASSRHGVRGTLESVQRTCRDLLHLSVSFVLGEEAESWESIRAAYARLHHTFRFWMTADRELLIDVSGEDESSGPEAEPALKTLKARLAELELLMESGQSEPFFETYAALMRENEPRNKDEALELYFALSHFFMSHLNRTGTMTAAEKESYTGAFAAAGQPFVRPETAGSFTQLAARLFELREAEQKEWAQQLICKVQQHIQHHLAEDLSLTRIAALVHHSPSYFSRLYKKVTGVDLSEYVAEQRVAEAKTLLKHTNLKIYEITSRVGYESVPYFIRLFKQHTSMTPQEYRVYNGH